MFVNAEDTGKNCYFQAGVVIGNKGGDENKPIDGNNVGFGLGCTVYGKIAIGDNVTVLPSAVATRDMPAYAIVCGISDKKIKYRE